MRSTFSVRSRFRHVLSLGLSRGPVNVLFFYDKKSNSSPFLALSHSSVVNLLDITN